jgi:hypothetical protein
MNLTTNAELLEARAALIPHNFDWMAEHGYTVRTHAYAIVSDTYKEVNGIRPRWMADYSFVMLVRVYADLRRELRLAIEQEQAEEQAHAEAVARLTSGATGFTIGELVSL